jgi:hypothetical protein
MLESAQLVDVIIIKDQVSVGSGLDITEKTKTAVMAKHLGMDVSQASGRLERIGRGPCLSHTNQR